MVCWSVSNKSIKTLLSINFLRKLPTVFQQGQRKWWYCGHCDLSFALCIAAYCDGRSKFYEVGSFVFSLDKHLGLAAIIYTWWNRTLCL